MLATKNCKLVSLDATHDALIHALYTNDKVRAYLGGTRTKSQIQVIYEEFLTMPYYWAVYEKQTNTACGLICLDQHHDGEYYELSYQFLPEWWGKGYAKQCALAVLHYAFEQLKVDKIIAETQCANRASCRLLESIGMTIDKQVERFGAQQYIYSKTKL